jgi:hypothetical protein
MVSRNLAEDLSKYYISYLQDPQCLPHARALVKSSLSQISSSKRKHEGRSQNTKTQSKPAEEPSPSVSVSHATNQTMSRLLNLSKNLRISDEYVKDFGSWRFLLSGNSIQYLRQTSRKDAHMFEVVCRKMKSVIAH